jgi:hypothetical protein
MLVSIPTWIVVVTLLGYAAGIVTMGIAAYTATQWAAHRLCDAADRMRYRRRVRREVARLDHGSCDGLSRSRIAALVDERVAARD